MMEDNDTCPDGSWAGPIGPDLTAQLAEKEREIARLENKCDLMIRQDREEVWYWADDGEDHPESLACPALIKPDVVRRFVAAEQRLQEAQAEIAKKSTCVGMMTTEQEAELIVANCACATQLEELRDEEHETYRTMVLNVQAGLDRHTAQLQAWKESQLKVTPDWQKIGELLNVGLGQSVTDNIIPAITDLRERLRQREAELEQAREIITRGLELAKIVREEINGLGAPMFPWEIDAATLLAAHPSPQKVQP